MLGSATRRGKFGLALLGLSGRRKVLTVRTIKQRNGLYWKVVSCSPLGEQERCRALQQGAVSLGWTLAANMLH